MRKSCEGGLHPKDSCLTVGLLEEHLTPGIAFTLVVLKIGVLYRLQPYAALLFLP
jgi:hypothetical protein